MRNDHLKFTTFNTALKWSTWQYSTPELCWFEQIKISGLHLWFEGRFSDANYKMLMQHQPIFLGLENIGITRSGSFWTESFTIDIFVASEGRRLKYNDCPQKVSNTPWHSVPLHFHKQVYMDASSIEPDWIESVSLEFAFTASKKELTFIRWSRMKFFRFSPSSAPSG